jgi:hypothetical protein
MSLFSVWFGLDCGLVAQGGDDDDDDNKVYYLWSHQKELKNKDFSSTRVKNWERRKWVKKTWEIRANQQRSGALKDTRRFRFLLESVKCRVKPKGGGAIPKIPKYIGDCTRDIVKSPCVHLVFGPPFNPLTPLLVVSLKQRNFIKSQYEMLGYWCCVFLSLRRSLLSHQKYFW